MIPPDHERQEFQSELIRVFIGRAIRNEMVLLVGFATVWDVIVFFVASQWAIVATNIIFFLITVAISLTLRSHLALLVPGWLAWLVSFVAFVATVIVLRSLEDVLLIAAFGER
jgi:hypothetical protein